MAAVATAADWAAREALQQAVEEVATEEVKRDREGDRCLPPIEAIAPRR